MTLWEALVVVAITALVATVTFPRVERATTTLALREEATALNASLRLARAQAVRLGTPVTFSVTRDGKGYGWSGSALRPLHDGFTVTPAGGAVVFYADGSSSGGMLALATARGNVPYRIDPTTGAVARVTQ
jgi:general secretion pathway protein H